MATVYFTSNADSGSGTLRAAINSAESGDTITYDPTVFTTGPIVISVSTALITTSKDLIFDGGELGIILDGQQTNIACVSLTTGTPTITFVNFTIKRFNRSVNGPIFLNSSGVVVNLHRCKIVDNQNNYFGAIYILNGTVNLYDSLVTGNNSKTNGSSYAGGIRLGNDGYLNLVRSTVVFNTNANVYGGTSRQTRTNSFIGFNSYTELGDIEYVNPPAESYIAFGDWIEGLWQNYDFRLKPTSPYLTGASYQSGDKDLLGHPRTGSWGCYDGSWLVVPANGTVTISSDTTVDYAEIGSGATVNFTNANLTVTKNADIDTSTFASSSTAYLAVPSGTYFNLSTFTNVVHCTYGGGVTAVSGSVDLRTCTFSVTKTGTETVDCIEYKTEEDTSWNKIVNLADSSTTFSTVTDKGFYLRAYDGVNFVTSSWIPRTYYYKGSATSGSFATSSDWAMDAQKTLTCNAAPSIKEGTFHCE